MSQALASHVPLWLLNRLKRESLSPGYTSPLEIAVLLARVAGITPLIEPLAQQGAGGAKVLAPILEALFGTLVETITAYAGDIVHLGGDTVTAFWRPAHVQDTAVATLLRATAAAQTLQETMRQLDVPLPAGVQSPALRIGLGFGSATLVVVGNAQQQRLLITGPALQRAIAAQQQAPEGHVALHETVQWRVGTQVTCDADGVLTRIQSAPSPSQPRPLPPAPPGQLHPFLHPALAERIQAGQESELTALIHDVVPMSVAFAAGNPNAIQEYVVQALGMIEKHGGYLSEIDVGERDNRLAALFGAPLSNEDNGARAAACALDLATLPATQAIGVASGTLFIGIVGDSHRRQYIAAGAPLHLAARLMQAALQADDPPAILLSTGVSRLAGDRFTYGEPQSLSTEDAGEPPETVRLLGWVQGWDSWLSPWLGQDDLVGRQEEMTHLEKLMARTLEGQGQVLTIDGEAGMGKSRLAGELLRRWLGWGGVAYVGASTAATQYKSYHAWGEVLRASFELRRDDQDAVRVQALIEAINPDWLPRLPLLSDVLGLGLPDNDLTRHFDAQLRQQSTQTLLVDLIRHRAGQEPLLLVLEDVHWMDQLSWQVALGVAHATRDLPLLLCLVHRPLGDLPPSAYHSLTDLPNHTALPLGELSPDEAVGLARVRLDVETLPEELAALIQHKSRGHPLFVEEIIHTLSEGDTLQVENGNVTVQGDLNQADLPDTVQGVVQTRLDRLDEGINLTLRVASVIGRTFPYHTLRAVHPIRPVDASLNAQLTLLHEMEITPMEHPRPEPSYIFKHAIIHDVIYEGIPIAQRRALHRAVGRWYETTYGGARDLGRKTVPLSLTPYLPLLVHHYHQAEDTERERYYAQLAGEQAAARYANQEALTYLNRALELAPQEDTPKGAIERYDLLLKREGVYHLQGAREAQIQDLAALARLAEVDKSGSQQAAQRRAEVALRQARYEERMSNYPAAIAAAQRAIELARKAQDVEIEAAAFSSWGDALWRQAQYEASRVQLEQAVSLARGADLKAVAADSLRTLGTTFMRQGDYAKAMPYYEQALDICREIGDRRRENTVLLSLGATHWTQGNHRASLTYNEQVLHISREIGSREIEAHVLNNLGLVFETTGDLVKAKSHIERSLFIKREIGDRWGVSNVVSNLADLLRQQGDYAEARVCFEESLDVCRAIGRSVVWACIGLGDVAAAQGDYASARIYYEQALHASREAGQQTSEGASLTAQSRLYHWLGEDESAYEYAQQALQIAQETQSRYAQSEALMSLGRALTGLGRLPEAADVYRQAVALQQDLGQTHLVIEPQAGLASVFLARGDLAQAQTQVEEVLAGLETRTIDGLREPFWIYWTCYCVLRANEDTRATEILNTAHQLLQERAAKINDDDLRRSFLENVPTQREILSAWQTQSA